MKGAQFLAAGAVAGALAFALRPTPLDDLLFIPVALAPVFFGVVAFSSSLVGIFFGWAKGGMLFCFGAVFGLAAIAIVILLGG